MHTILDFFAIGIGPSSSHCVGPMRAARRFTDDLAGRGALPHVARVEVTLFGSLALTGKGHGTDKAVILGLLGETPEAVPIESIDRRIEAMRQQERLTLAGRYPIRFCEPTDLRFDRKTRCKVHPNQLCFKAWDESGAAVAEAVYYSVGGGFVLSAKEVEAAHQLSPEGNDERPYPFRTGAELLAQALSTGLAISEVVRANEQTMRSDAQLTDEIMQRWRVMQQCVENGCRSEGVLPGGLKVRRRAPNLFKKLSATEVPTDPLAALDWVDLFALAVNEENAAGGRVVTAPTNGAAGIVPAVLHYYMKFDPRASDESVVRFFLVAGAIAMLYKLNASISGAEVGCQGEVGVAASMAAAALAEVQGGSPRQVLQAAEIAMEHHLGLTCDPIGGLVQVPCIERNAVAAVTAINAARLALTGDGEHRVSLDKVIATMRQTGADMSAKYKETARGGLAIQVNVIEC